MKLNSSNQIPTPCNQTRPQPQMVVRSNLHAGLNEDCALGVGYWRKELNRLKDISSALNCS